MSAESIAGALDAPVADALIESALNSVHDPCSLASNAPLGLVDMGLVLGWEQSAPGVLAVRLCTTGPGCMMAGNIMRAAVEQLERVPGVRQVDLEFDAGFMWTPDRMSQAGAERLDAARKASQSVRPIAPQQWRGLA